MHPAFFNDNIFAQATAKPGDANESHLLAQIIGAFLTRRTCPVDHEWLYNNRIADLHTVDALAYFFNDARKLMTQDHREGLTGDWMRVLSCGSRWNRPIVIQVQVAATDAVKLRRDLHGPGANLR